MSAPPFTLLYTPEAKSVLLALQHGPHADKGKLHKTRKALRLLAGEGPSYRGFQTHRYQSVPGPGGKPLWESYIENQTPSAWRMWWIYGPGEADITIVTFGPHL